MATQVHELVDGAAYLFCNEYEAALIEQQDGLDGAEILTRVRVRITTLGADGARVEQQGQPPVMVAAVPDAKPGRPDRVGRRVPVGLPGRRRLGPVPRARRAARQPDGGARAGDHGPAGVQAEARPLTERFATAYGDAAAAEVTTYLSA